MKVAPSKPALVYRQTRDEMSTGQGMSLRRRSVSELGAQSAPVPQWRTALGVHRLEGQVAAAPKAAEGVLRIVEAAKTPAQKVLALTTELLKRARELPARDAAFTACRPALLQALSTGAALGARERTQLLLAVDRLVLAAPRSQAAWLGQSVLERLKPTRAELEPLVRLRPTPFMQGLAGVKPTPRPWQPR
ncbi:MAG: hypothetical protein JNK82_27615 [Myxococcaceae bacterium]|nr:hypothetical protein [Myxococcaceae bacterium]